MFFAVWGGLVSLTAGEAAAQAVTQLSNNRIFVHGITPLTGATVRNVDSVDWSVRNNLLIFDRRGLNQLYNVYSITAEGFRLTALTLERGGGSAELHNCAPVWHPSGNYFLFCGENRGSTDSRRSGPGSGWHSNLWLATRDGNKFWQLTDLPTRYNAPRGVTMPTFSPDGKKVFWTGFAGKAAAATPFEQRDLRLADFSTDGPRPRLSNEQVFQPGNRRDFYESYGFSPDGSRLLFAANLDEGQPWYCMDICTLGRGETDLVALTPHGGGWDRHAVYSPDGRKILWSSSRTFNVPFMGPGGTAWARYLRSELWIMDADGNNPRQLTFFNSLGAPEFDGRRAFVGDLSWGPDSSRFAMVLYRETRGWDVESQVVLVTLGRDAPRSVRSTTTPREEPAAAPPEAPPPVPKPAPTRPDKKGDAGTPATPTW
jgi:Tol biopolymer transport system component